MDYLLIGILLASVLMTLVGVGIIIYCRKKTGDKRGIYLLTTCVIIIG